MLALHGLAEHLGPAFALYALQHRGADGRCVYDQSIEQMAERGLDCVRRVQPEGPYRLCGTSFGGLVALDVARRLRAAGEADVDLTLFDTYGPGYPVPRAGVSPRLRFRRALRALRPLGRPDTPGLGVLWQGLREKLIRLLARWLVRVPMPRARRLPRPLRYTFLQEACFAAFRRYAFAPYTGPVTLFRVSEQPSSELYQPDEWLGLGAVLRGAVRLETVEAPGHGAHLREPWVRALARRYATVLNEAVPAHRPAAGVTPDAAVAATAPCPEKWDAAALWNGLAPWWHAKTALHGSDLFTGQALATVEEVLGIGPGMRVLEIACGSGWFARRMSARGAHVTALDISEGMLRLARAHDGAGNQPEYRCLDVTAPGCLSAFDASSFDRSVCNMALQDIQDIESMFRFVRPVVKAGGLFVLSFVHPDNPARSRAPLGLPSPQVAFADQPRPHIEIRRSLTDIQAAARRAGWDIRRLLERPSPAEPLIAILVLGVLDSESSPRGKPRD